MNRSPLFYPLNRGMDADAGGAAELQTDVMRFMAIISLCLVAIFALVQSMPLLPEQPPSVDPEPVDIVEPPPTPEPVEISRPMPEKLTPVERQPVTTNRVVVPPVPEPAPQPDTTPTRVESTPSPEKTVASDEPVIDGFTLRFENDRALTQLVGGNEVGLFAIAPGKTQQMQLSNGRIRFTPSTAPTQYHEMEISTVPDNVISAFRQHGALPPAAVQWGVTLPADMTRSLNRYLADHAGGELVIHDDGILRLEQ